MSRTRERDGAVTFINVMYFILCLFLAYWQFNTIAPTTVAGDTSWWHGLLHGIFAAPNFIFSLLTEKDDTIFQAGGQGGYAFWWLIGSGLFFGSTRVVYVR